MQKQFDYHRNLHNTVTHALLHLLSSIATSKRFVPVGKRNEMLIKYLKPKVSDKNLANIKKDIKLMLSAARTKGGNLEMKLYELNAQSYYVKLSSAERLYSLLIYLYDEEGLESRLFEEGDETQPGILYMIAEHIDNAFDEQQKQVAPMSMFIQLERAPEVIDAINRHGSFIAEMKEWNQNKQQAHLLLHPSHRKS